MRIKTLANLLFMIPILNASAQSGYSLELHIKTQPTDAITLNETRVAGTYFKNMDSQNKITATFRYKNTEVHYSLDQYGLQNSLDQYTSFENDFQYSHQLTGTTKLNVAITPILNFERNPGLSDLSILGGLEVTHSFNPKNSIRIGVKKSTVLGKAQLLPAVSFHHQLNQRTGMEIGFPNSAITYSDGRHNRLSFTNSFNGNVYQLDHPRVITETNTATKASFSQMTSTLEYERNMDSNFYVSLNAGYECNKKYHLTNDSGDSNFNFNSTNGYLFNIGIKYKH